MTQNEWAGSFVKTVADQIKRHRNQQRMSARELSEACEAAGLSIPRNVISNLEAGRRPHLSVTELLVLASVLRVPPLQLLLPVGVEDEIEVLPGRTTPTWEAARWVTGELPLVSEKHEREMLIDVGDFESWEIGAQKLRAFREHDRLIEERRSALVGAAGARHAAEAGEQALRSSNEQLAKAEQQRADEYTRALWNHRAYMRKNGMVLPELPRDLAGLEEQTSEQGPE